MAKVEVKNLKNEKTKDLTLNAKVFGVEVNEVVLKKAIFLIISLLLIFSSIYNLSIFNS